jgi:hypothetical protein
VTLIALIVQETLQRLQQKRSESPLTSISGLNETTSNDSAKEFLSQILRVRNGVALSADERENWPPINFAKLGKRSLCFLFITGRVRAGQNNTPTRRHEPSLAEAIKGGFRFHRRRSSHFIGYYASLGLAPQSEARGAVEAGSRLFSKLRPEKSEL